MTFFVISDDTGGDPAAEPYISHGTSPALPTPQAGQTVTELNAAQYEALIADIQTIVLDGRAPISDYLRIDTVAKTSTVLPDDRPEIRIEVQGQAVSSTYGAFSGVPFTLRFVHVTTPTFTGQLGVEAFGENWLIQFENGSDEIQSQRDVALTETAQSAPTYKFTNSPVTLVVANVRTVSGKTGR